MIPGPQRSGLTGKQRGYLLGLTNGTAVIKNELGFVRGNSYWGLLWPRRAAVHQLECTRTKSSSTLRNERVEV